MTGLRVVFAGGGTGGHLSPAIAVADLLAARLSDSAILFLGSDRPIEREVLARAGHSHAAVPMPSRADFWRRPLSSALQGRRAVLEAGRWLDRQQAEVVVGCGGMASVPTVWAAHRRRIPIVLLEQNLLPGRANRWLARWATCVCLSFAESGRWLPKRSRCVLTGNPVRRAIIALRDEMAAAPAPQSATAAPVLLALGGSLGASGLNAALLDALAADRHLWRGWRIVHQTGAAEHDAVAARHRELGTAAETAPFFHDLPQRMAAADLVVTRAGASTLAELACLGRPTIVVPWDRSADDHQTHNARWLANRGAVLWASEQTPRIPTGRGSDVAAAGDAVDSLVTDRSLDPSSDLGSARQVTSAGAIGRPLTEPPTMPSSDVQPLSLTSALRRFLTDPAERARCSQRFSALAIPDAADRVLTVVLDAAQLRQGAS